MRPETAHFCQSLFTLGQVEKGSMSQMLPSPSANSLVIAGSRSRQVRFGFGHLLLGLRGFDFPPPPQGRLSSLCFVTARLGARSLRQVTLELSITSPTAPLVSGSECTTFQTPLPGYFGRCMKW